MGIGAIQGKDYRKKNRSAQKSRRTSSRTLADVRKEHELAKKGKTGAAAGKTATPNLPAVIEQPKYNFNFMDMVKKQFGISDNNYNIPATGKKPLGLPAPKAATNLPAVVEKPKYNFNFMDMVKNQFGISDNNYNIPTSSGKKTLGLPAPLSTTAGSATQGVSGSVAGSAAGAGASAGTAGTPSVLNPFSHSGNRAGGAQPNGGVKVISIHTNGVNPNGATGQAASHTLGLPASVSGASGATGAGAGAAGGAAEAAEAAGSTKPSGLWEHIKSAFAKGKSFLKTGKGKLAIAGLALVALAGGTIAYLNDRFADRGNVPHTGGASYVPLPDDENNDSTETVDDSQDSTQTQETDETQETETAPADETQETDSTSDDTTDTQTAAAATATGVAAPADSSAQDNETAVASADAQTTTPADSTSTAPADSTATAPADSTTTAHADSTGAAQAHTPDPDKLNGDTYDVVKGDCVWNIAKAHLKALHKDKTGYEPTDIEILNHTKELMDKNNLHYENDNCHVLIKPGDKLDIKAA